MLMINVVFHHTFSLQAWVWVEAASGSFASILDEASPVFKWINPAPVITYFYAGVETASSLASYAFEEWNLLTIECELDGAAQTSTFNLYSNLVQVLASDTRPTAFIDDAGYSHYVGKDETFTGGTSGFQGYIYELCLHNQLNTP
jgi:hypothetical protein